MSAEQPLHWAERVYHVTWSPSAGWHVQSEPRVLVKWLVRVQDMGQHKHTHFPTRLCSQTAKVNARLVMEKLDEKINEQTSGLNTHTTVRKKSHGIKHRGNYPMFFCWRIRKHGSTCDTKKKAASSLTCDGEKETKVRERQSGRRKKNKTQKQRNTRTDT